MTESANTRASLPTRTGGRARHAIESYLAEADIRVNGSRPWDIQVHDERLFPRIAAHGTLGAGEAYVEGWWDAVRLDQTVERVHRAGLPQRFRSLWHTLKARLLNLQTRARAWDVGRRHYDFGNDLYTAMLDRRMIYTCGYWREAADLDSAQEAKLNLVASKLRLRPGMTVLDIGCGWGGAARYLAEHHDVRVVGCTISREQAALARNNVADVDVDIQVQDYRDVRGQFDAAYSLGMFEHVGYKNYAEYMRVVRGVLKPQALFVLHTIGSNRSVYNTDPWIERYIFPNSMLPSVAQIGRAAEDNFVMEDWHNFGPDYYTTLMCWCTNLERNWHTLADRYDDAVRRMFRYFLLSSAGSFRARVNQLWQVVLSPEGVDGTYNAPR